MLNIEGIDLHRAGIEHLLWKRRIRNYLDDKDDRDLTETVSHKTCRLGLWLYSSGIKKFGNFTELREMEMAHVEIHNIASKVMRLKQDGNMAEADIEYEKLDKTSKTLVVKLTALAVKLSS